MYDDDIKTWAFGIGMVLLTVVIITALVLIASYEWYAHISPIANKCLEAK